MHVLITGAAGMLGRKLTARLLDAGTLPDGTPVERLTLVDITAAEAPAGSATALDSVAVDLSGPGEAERLVARRPDLIVHLAAIVSSEAEADFVKGYQVNLDGTRQLFEAVRQEGLRQPYMPRLIFASSIAVFGAPFPGRIDDDFLSAPLTSYGTQKAIGELLLADYTRRGIVAGIGLRLPTVCVRPGAPNKAASGFFSSILREPLAGREALLPVADETRHWFASPQATVGFFMHAATLDLSRLGWRRNLTMPGLSASVGEQIEALRRVAGEDAVRLIRRELDPAIAAIVTSWPQDFDAHRAAQLGFVADRSMEAIVRQHIEDERGG